jgi:streptomycin 6-kinase
VSIPASLRAGVAAEEGADVWLAGLPSLVHEFVARWNLEPGEPFEGGMTSWTAPVRRDDGTDAVLKIVWPHREAREEATALRLWDGDGAVTLLDEDRERWVLLLERCLPGTTLRDTVLPADDALSIGADVLTRLWRNGPDEGAHYELLTDVAHGWATMVRDHLDDLDTRFDAGLLALGADLLDELPRSATRAVLLHGDFNPGNLLAATRTPWLAIDCKPMIGDAAFDPSQFVLQARDPFSEPDAERVLDERFKRFADLIGEDPRRCIAWGVARETEYAVWESARGHAADAHDAMERVAMLARVAAL